MKYFSHSRLQTFKQCPAQFKIRYVDGVRKSDESIEAFMGLRVHEALEYLYNQVVSEHTPLFDEVIDKYYTSWEEKWHNRIGIYRRELLPIYYQTLGEDCLARYYRKHFPFEQTVVANEVVFDFTLNNDEKYPMKGIVDRLDHDGNGNWEIHDYKSGKRAMTQYQADKDGQLALYQIALMSKEKNVKSVNLVWHYLQHGNAVNSKRSNKQLADISNQLKRNIDAIRIHIENDYDFPPKPMILCNWCYYWEECPAKSGSNPNIR